MIDRCSLCPATLRYSSRICEVRTGAKGEKTTVSYCIYCFMNLSQHQRQMILKQATKRTRGRPPDIRTINEAIKEAKGNWSKASTSVKLLVMEDPELFREMLLPYVDKAVWNHVRKSFRLSGIPGPVKKPSKRRANLTHALRRIGIENLLDYQIKPGLKLADATASEVEGISRLHTMASKWLSKIAERTEKGKMVKDCLSNQDLADMLNDAGTGIGEGGLTCLPLLTA